MNLQEMLMLKVAGEAGEIAQAVEKCLCYGPLNKSPDKPPTNGEINFDLLYKEMIDLIGNWQLLLLSMNAKLENGYNIDLVEGKARDMVFERMAKSLNTLVESKRECHTLKVTDQKLLDLYVKIQEKKN